MTSQHGGSNFHTLNYISLMRIFPRSTCISWRYVGLIHKMLQKSHLLTQEVCYKRRCLFVWVIIQIRFLIGYGIVCFFRFFNSFHIRRIVNPWTSNTDFFMQSNLLLYKISSTLWIAKTPSNEILHSLCRNIHPHI